jgi:hypothetical protein
VPTPSDDATLRADEDPLEDDLFAPLPPENDDEPASEPYEPEE